jgi:hypothetical protein
MVGLEQFIVEFLGLSEYLLELLLVFLQPFFLREVLFVPITFL